MKVSKTQFINYIHFYKYASIEAALKLELDNLKDRSLEDLMLNEDKNKKNELLHEIYQENNDDITTTKEDLKLSMMQPYYDQLELLSGRAIKDMFGGRVIFDMNTFNQKRFSYQDERFEFFCFLDGYQEDDETIRVFETKATTSKKFLDNYTFKQINDKYSMFVKLPSGIYVPREDLEKDLSDDYYNKEKKMFNQADELGKYVYDLAYQRYVYEKNEGLNKKREYYLVILNHEYVHDGTCDEFLKPIYSNDIVRFFNLTSVVNKMHDILKEDTKIVVEMIDNPKKRSGLELIEEIPKENSIFVYTDRHHGFKDKFNNRYDLIDLLAKGIIHAKDLPIEYLNRKNNQIQRSVIDSKIPYYNYEKIKDGIKQLKYPIYHLDFESFNAPLPRYKGEIPYTQSVFQYSIHIERSPGVCNKDLDHYEYLASDHSDHRKALLESMLNVIKPDGGSVLVYNVAFERGRLKDFQQCFPKYHQEIEDIINRLFDLMYIVKNNTNLYLSLGYEREEASTINFYHNDLQGSFSIKYVLPIFSNLTYEGMNVGNGIDAMIAYNRFSELEGDEFIETYNDLVNYCKQDTWAMFEILNALRKI